MRDIARRLRTSNVGRLFGFELASATASRTVLKMRVRPRHRQVHGVVHGGIIASLADTAGGMACYMAVPPGTRVATVEMKINFLEPVDRGTVTAEAHLLRKGRTFAVAECEVRDAKGQLAAKALMTFALIHSGPANV